ncbi:hypothetical protein JXA32_11225 [Candidatus Sumerlaeota bacterium]|nr:hypothetical protein [Candidatus Sumerlaeota bacterium]
MNSDKTRHNLAARAPQESNPLFALMLTLAFPLTVYVDLELRAWQFGFDLRTMCFYVALNLVILGLAWSVSETAWLLWGLPERAIQARFWRQALYAAAILLASAILAESEMKNEEQFFRQRIATMQLSAPIERIVWQPRRWPNRGFSMFYTPSGEFGVQDLQRSS